MSSPVAAQVLLIEDNPGDVVMIQEAFADIGFAHHLYEIQTGEAGLDFLFRRSEYRQAPRPDIVLLDLNLPGLSGMEVLETIKGDERLRIIPVLVLTTSNNEQDILGCYQRAGNCHIVKPTDFGSYVAIARQIESFWFGLVKRPSTRDPAPPYR